MNQTKNFNGKKYYLITSVIGIGKKRAYSIAKDHREMAHRARVVKEDNKYFVYVK